MLCLMKMDCAVQNGWEKTFERMCLFEFFPTYVDTSKQKNHSSMTSMNSMYTWSIFVMEQLFVAIQTISPMESGMIG